MSKQLKRLMKVVLPRLARPLYRQLQQLATEKQDLDHKMQDWESSYRELRELKDRIVKAYGSLSQ